MAIKVIAQRRVLKIGKNPGVKKFVMRPELYTPIQEKKVFKEASIRSGISAGAMKAAWDAAGEVIKAWATEGHSVPLPGLGTMRFGVRSKLADTAIQITSYDRNGQEGKRVTSADEGIVEDNDNVNDNVNNGGNGNDNDNGNDNPNEGGEDED